MDTERSERPIRVLIADDQASIREGLELLLGLSPDVEAVGTATDGEDAVLLDPSIQRRLIPQLRGTAPVEQTSYCGGRER